MEADMKTATVHVRESLNLDQSHKVLATVLGKLGCPNCFSGFKISFDSAVDPANIVLSVEKGSHKVMEVGG
jgi:hypothetical protein